MNVIKWLFAVAILVLLADGLILTPYYYKRLSPYTYDKEMGWVPKQDFSRNFHQRDSAGKSYDASYSLDHHRFRAYGDPATRNIKILFLGDSFTGDPFTGNNEMYFSMVKTAFREKYHKDVEIFAVGGGGYGTLQEYLLIKNKIKTINPDIFVLQFSDNDFCNNLLEWESQGIVRNQYLFRPYYAIKSGGIYHSPSPFAGIYSFLYKNSHIFERADIISQMLQFKYFGDYSRKLTLQEKERFEKESYDVTKQLFVLLKNEFGKETKLFMMVDVTDDKHINDLQVTLAKETGYIPLLFPLQNLNKFEAEHKGAVLRHADGGHLNILGNKILGEGLAEELAAHMSR
jgi:hypothetical protein